MSTFATADLEAAHGWDLDDYSEDGAIRHYFLVSYNAVTGEWGIDDDAIYFPDRPIMEDGKFRKMNEGEIDMDVTMRGSLKKALASITEADDE